MLYIHLVCSFRAPLGLQHVCNNQQGFTFRDGKKASVTNTPNSIPFIRNCLPSLVCLCHPHCFWALLSKFVHCIHAYWDARFRAVKQICCQHPTIVLHLTEGFLYLSFDNYINVSELWWRQELLTKSCLLGPLLPTERNHEDTMGGSFSSACGVGWKKKKIGEKGEKSFS